MSAPRIGVDVGGTFTDVALERADGSFTSTKVLTTHERPEEGILAGIASVAGREGLAMEEITQIIHGTTLATNALIERRGARTALVTTAGFRDVIETRTESRFEQYDLNIVLPAPLIERKDRYVVPERIGAGGEVLLAFDEQAPAVLSPSWWTAVTPRWRSGSCTATGTRTMSAGSGSCCARPRRRWRCR